MKKILLFLIGITATFYVTGQTVFGVDVSHHQGNIDWDQVYADGYVFAFTKATEGNYFIDSKYVQNTLNGLDAGVVMGAYHFARPDYNTAEVDAAFFVNIAGDYIASGFLPPVIDIEDPPPPGVPLTSAFTSAELTSWVQQWLTYVENHTGIEPIIYTSPNIANYLNSSLNSYDLWIADPDQTTDPPNNIGNWTTWAFKQYSWWGNVAGISGDVDLDFFNGTIDDFNNYVGVLIPVNDSCVDARIMYSNINCDYIGGTVDNANNETVLSAASCDDYSGTPLLADVFYKFTALQETHTITVEPTGDLDAVVALYEGDCSSLTENACVNTAGTGEIETLLAENLIPGTTYWVRIYNYGDQAPVDGDFHICTTHENTDDLFISNPVATPLTIDAGTTLHIECDYEYSGSTPNSYFPIVDVGYLLSDDIVYDASDSYFGSDGADLGSTNTSEHETAAIPIPASKPTGTYYILFVADYNNEVEEVDETNNVAYVQINIVNTVSVQDLSLTDLKLFPNPTSGTVKFETEYDIKNISVYNVFGSILFSGKPTDNFIDLSGFTNGVYFVKFTDKNDKNVTLKVVKR